MTDVDYDLAVQYLLSFADFETSGRFQERPDVAPVLSLLRRLGDPHLGRLTVHVAGSKGKGSVSAMIESMLRAPGLRTGMFTSPHLHDYTERIRVGGEPIAPEEFARLVSELQPAIEAERVAIGERRFVTFDLLTAMAFVAFREAGAEAQVIEVGLGGRLDSTNVFAAKDVAVITPLSYEHTAILGDRIEQIAAEKAAIITRDCTAVLAPQRYPEAANVVRDFAAKAGATLVDVTAEYRWSISEQDLHGQAIRIERPRGAIDVRLPLLGSHQAENAATAVAAVDALVSPPREKQGGSGGHPQAPGMEASLPFTHRDERRRWPDARSERLDEAIVRGLESVDWPGRLEVLRERPLVIADGAHNAESARRLREALEELVPGRRVTFVIGAGADKDISGLAAELAPVAGRLIATRTAHPRAMDARLIVKAFGTVGVRGEDVDSVPEAIELALAATDEGGVICLAGSLFVAAEAREYMCKQTSEPAGGVHGG